MPEIFISVDTDISVLLNKYIICFQMQQDQHKFTKTCHIQGIFNNINSTTPVT